MAQDCLMLAALIDRNRSGNITLVSLARAGTPVGVILKHLLEKIFGRIVKHYSVSIVRDKGIDAVALRYILAEGHRPESIVFIDGWTGKGVISRELKTSVAQFNESHDVKIDTGLYVLADLAGTAACAASSMDYLIPSSILNATVSGLISRSILNDDIGPNDFHGCVFYKQFEPHDQSRDFAAGLIKAATDLVAKSGVPAPESADKNAAAAISTNYIKEAMIQYGIQDVNLIKPGLGEATRVLLRRVPRLLILRTPNSPHVNHLQVLSEEKNVPVLVDPNLPYEAVSLIGSALDG
jgi:hypothetical protein